MEKQTLNIDDDDDDIIHLLNPQRHKSGDIRRVGWRLANFTCKIVGKVQKLQPV